MDQVNLDEALNQVTQKLYPELQLAQHLGFITSKVI